MCESICILPLFFHDVGNNINWDISMWYIPSYTLYSLVAWYHRTAEIGRDLWRSSGPSLCSSRATQVVQDRVQAAFEYLQGTLTLTVIKVFLDV